MSQSGTAGRRRALLIGCPTGLLRGVSRDLQTMKRILEAYGFDCSSIAYQATRAEFINFLVRFAQQTSAGDAVVIYYSGHGGLVSRSSVINSGRPLQFLIPCDFGETTEDDFRGVTDTELSRYLREITNKTDNVTLILDCCHAARMARLPGIVKTIDPTLYANVFGHIHKMLQKGALGADASDHHERNPKLLTIAASGHKESAYEQPFAGDQRSVLSEALERVLGSHRNQDGSLQRNVSWRSVMLRVKERLKVTCPQQFPHVEGDDLRFIFSLSRADMNGALPLEVINNRVILHGGELHGIRSGDTYKVVPAAAERRDLARVIATATVQRVGSIRSSVTLDTDLSHVSQHYASGMKAFPKSRKMGKLPVVVRHWHSPVNIMDLIGRSPFLRVADENDQAPFAKVYHTNTTMDLWSNESGEYILMGRWELTTAAHFNMVTECIERMESMARSRHLFAVAMETESKDVAKQVSVEVGTVEDGIRNPSGPQGLAIKEGENIYIQIHNNGPKTVHVSILDLCADSVALLSTGSPRGYELHKGETYLYGERDLVFSDFIGSSMSWPRGIPRHSRRLFEKIVIVITNIRLEMDLRCLETGSRSVTRGDQLDEAGLSDFLSDIYFDTTRTIQLAQNQEAVQFGMRWLSFELRQA